MIETRSLAHGYGDRGVLNGVDLTIRDGEFVLFGAVTHVERDEAAVESTDLTLRLNDEV